MRKKLKAKRDEVDIVELEEEPRVQATHERSLKQPKASKKALKKLKKSRAKREESSCSQQDVS